MNQKLHLGEYKSFLSGHREKKMTKKIMIVDDDKELLEELNEVLSSNGYDAVTFNDSMLALKKVREIIPALIILDMKMEQKNGFQFANELKIYPETSYIPIIAMTGFYTEKEHMILLSMLGIQVCMIKPFKPKDLISKINEILKKGIKQ